LLKRSYQKALGLKLFIQQWISWIGYQQELFKRKHDWSMDMSESFRQTFEDLWINMLCSCSSSKKIQIRWQSWNGDFFGLCIKFQRL
jgi:hypothetical protein